MTIEVAEDPEVEVAEEGHHLEAVGDTEVVEVVSQVIDFLMVAEMTEVAVALVEEVVVGSHPGEEEVLQDTRMILRRHAGCQEVMKSRTEKEGLQWAEETDMMIVLTEDHRHQDQEISIQKCQETQED